MSVALTAHLVAAPVIYGLLAHRYYRRRTEPSPFVVAATFLLTTITLDLLVVAQDRRGRALGSLASPDE